MDARKDEETPPDKEQDAPESGQSQPLHGESGTVSAGDNVKNGVNGDTTEGGHMKSESEIKPSGEGKGDMAKRPRKATEKGIEYALETKLRDIKGAIQKWRSVATKAEILLSESEDISALKGSRDLLEVAILQVSDANNDLTALNVPEDPRIADKIDETETRTLDLLRRITERIRDIENEAKSQGSRNSSRSSRSQASCRSSRSHGSRASHQSVNTAEKRAEAAAEAAALTAKLRHMKDEATKKAELEQLQTKMQLDMANARMVALDKALSSEQLNVNAPEFVPMQGAYSTTTSIPKQEDVCVDNLAKAVAEQISINRFPAPEPSPFSGDPLQFPAWKSALEILVERKGIPENERIFYLKRYLSGPAKEAVEGFFMLPTSESYRLAKQLLEERYGDPFTVTNAFRDKLNDWKPIPAGNKQRLRNLSDFLYQCLAAIQLMPSLSILNDERENKKILDKLPKHVADRWTRIVSDCRIHEGTFPTFERFVKFLQKEARIMNDPLISDRTQRGDIAKGEAAPKVKPTRSLVTKGSEDHTNTSQPYTGNKNRTCKMCNKDDHGIMDCTAFLALTLEEKKQIVSSKGLCYGCLKGAHMVRECKARLTCTVCKKKHPTSMHDPNKVQSKAVTTEDAVSFHTNLHESGPNTSYMSTMILPVFVSHDSNPDVEVLTYAMLDTQSDSTFIVSSTCQQLSVSGPAVNLSLSTLSSESKIVRSQRIAGLRVRGVNCDTIVDLPTTYTRSIMPADRTHIPTPDTAKKWPHLRSISNKLQPMIDCDVGILIGYNCTQALVPRKVITDKDGGPYAQLTDLGWTIIGCTNPVSHYKDEIGVSHKIIASERETGLSATETVRAHVVLRTKVKEIFLPKDAARLLENDFSEKQTDGGSISLEDQRFIDLMTNSIHSADNGHLEMPLPFKTQEPTLPCNRKMAAQRLAGLSKKFKRNPRFHEEYAAFMTDIISKGYAEPVTDENQSGRNQWYIPHHGVYHPRKGKLRVVFDCSARFGGRSLNEELMTGPDLLNTLVGVLCRFRRHSVGLICDIEAMFHQFMVNPKHRNYLKFLWWDNGDLSQPPRTYRMTVHLFGAASSPGCCNFRLKYLASNHKEEFGKKVSDFIEDDFYMDDGVTSEDSPNEVLELYSESKQLLQKGGRIHLHKFLSNSREAMMSVPEDDRASSTKKLDLLQESLPMERTLGINWCTESDTFQFHTNLSEKPLTRRGVLSTVSALYDPLGFIAPVILIGKMILQELCKNGASWDDPLPSSLKPRWKRWKEDLHLLPDIEIPRWYGHGLRGPTHRMEMHHFSDASTVGYGQCSYLRLITADNQVHCSLVMSKARVTPLKPVTIPRLELTAALTSVRISVLLKRELKLEYEDYFWTDSQVVLGYINNDAKRFHVYVANRVKEIRDHTDPSQWFHVSTNENPADMVSRGMTVEELLKRPDWFSGPKQLYQQDIHMASGEYRQYAVSNDDPEVRKVVLKTMCKSEPSLLQQLCRYSSWTMMKKIVALCLKVKHNMKGNGQPLAQTVANLNDAEKTIIKLVQLEAFPHEVKSLGMGKPIKGTSDVSVLDPFVDASGLLRVGGRIKNGTQPYEEQHPVLLPKNHHVSDAILRHLHKHGAHQGRGMTLNEMRSNGYWVLGASKAVARLISKCVTCRKLRGQTATQKMADLPFERANPAPPFTNSGMDCFGPFYIKEGRKELKRWGVLFTCMASRAVHLEVVTSMSTDGFLNALRRFINVRGAVRQIKSDQGTNFVGANNELRNALDEVDDEKVRSHLRNNQCEFIFNPPHASHHGGVWERQIRTVRSILTALLQDHGTQLDDDSLRTLMTETSCIINSRPLTTTNLNDPTSMAPLTPNHLLTLKSSVILPPPGNFQRPDLYSRKRWRRVQYLADQFWSRWKNEYLQQLQGRQKSQKPQRNMEVGDIVLLKEDDLPRCQWRLARITNAQVSSDGHVRKAQIVVGDPLLSKNGKRIKPMTTLERPVNKLVLLLEAK